MCRPQCCGSRSLRYPPESRVDPDPKDQGNHYHKDPQQNSLTGSFLKIILGFFLLKKTLFPFFVLMKIIKLNKTVLMKIIKLNRFFLLIFVAYFFFLHLFLDPQLLLICILKKYIFIHQDQFTLQMKYFITNEVFHIIQLLIIHKSIQNSYTNCVETWEL